MGYPIIFETKIIRLQDGRYLHLDRSGCNNDSEGRVQRRFTSRGIFTKEGIEDKVSGLMASSKPFAKGGEFNLKIRYKEASYFDYGKHLQRMFRSAQTFARFVEKRSFMARYVEEIEILIPEHKVVSPERFNEIYWEAMRNATSLSWLPIYHECDVSNEDEIVRCIEEGKNLEFFISPEIRK